MTMVEWRRSSWNETQ